MMPLLDLYNFEYKYARTHTLIIFTTNKKIVEKQQLTGF